MTFKNKKELTNSLKIAYLKKDFRLKKVINSRDVFSLNVHIWSAIGHLTSHNPHATTKVIGKYFENRIPNGKGPSTRDMSNQLHAELGCKVSY
ncbi:hypothetical protein H5410_055892 [Solanum commersonii]|uniref:Uncharacterized protein n=1 Tax=Solanum commersonii TaxID=4109 RepID=A0A9J5WLK9_SOLCO|nr:hypothetical protein H5410_055892 [Solanum commersonii]